MEILPFDDEVHLSQVLSLLSASLTNPKGHEWFKWKHRESPFGPSQGFVAVEKEKVIGVRLFMPWHFQNQNENVIAIRPVDTATALEARGKGVFTKLTLAGLDKLKDTYQFVFNTPNTNSYPGYIKMGWTDLQTSKTVYFIPPFWKSEGELKIIKKGIDAFQPVLPTTALCTELSESYLFWRYKDSASHCIALDHEQPNGMVIELKKRKGVTILVIKEFWGTRPVFFSLCFKAMKAYRAQVALSMYDESLFEKYHIKWMSTGSRVVYRGPQQFKERAWHFSLGDIDSRM